MIDTLIILRLLIVLLGAYTFWVLVRDFVKGSTSLRPGLPVFVRADHPKLYWATMVFWGFVFVLFVACSINLWSGNQQ